MKLGSCRLPAAIAFNSTNRGSSNNSSSSTAHASMESLGSFGKESAHRNRSTLPHGACNLHSAGHLQRLGGFQPAVEGEPWTHRRIRNSLEVASHRWPSQGGG
eukprot:RCo046935